MFSMNSQIACFRIVAVLIIGLIELVPTSKQGAVSIPNSHIESNDDKSNDEILQAFAINSSAPGCGLHFVSILGKPNFSAYYAVYYSDKFHEVFEAIDLRENQTEALTTFRDFTITETAGDSDFALFDETMEDSELYSFLDSSQRHVVELLGLRLDGCSAFLRSYWIDLLALEPQQVTAIKERVTHVRESRVFVRFRNSFAGSSRELERVFFWHATTDSVSFNLWAISQLNQMQKSKLVKLLAESDNYNSAVEQMNERFLGFHRKEK